jgi:hypothetical protein
MSEFTFLFRGKLTPGSPEERQKHLEKWSLWMKELRAHGHANDHPGRPLEGSGKIVSGKNKLVKDGPFAEAKDIVGGFMLIEAEDLAKAVELAKQCPLLDVGGSVEVRPVQVLGP